MINTTKERKSGQGNRLTGVSSGKDSLGGDSCPETWREEASYLQEKHSEKGNIKYNDPEAGVCLTCSRSNKKESVAGTYEGRKE